MKKLTILMLAVAVALTALGQTYEYMNRKEAEQQITATYERMYQLMISKDVNSLGTMLADSFELIHMTGMHQPKSVYLQSIADGTLNYYSVRTEHLAFDRLGDTSATITGQSRVNAAVFGGGRHTWPLQLRISLELHDGQWIMTRATASTY